MDWIYDVPDEPLLITIRDRWGGAVIELCALDFVINYKQFCPRARRILESRGKPTDSALEWWYCEYKMRNSVFLIRKRNMPLSCNRYSHQAISLLTRTARCFDEKAAIDIGESGDGDCLNTCRLQQRIEGSDGSAGAPFCCIREDHPLLCTSEGYEKSRSGLCRVLLEAPPG